MTAFRGRGEDGETPSPLRALPWSQGAQLVVAFSRHEEPDAARRRGRSPGAQAQAGPWPARSDGARHRRDHRHRHFRADRHGGGGDGDAVPVCPQCAAVSLPAPRHTHGRHRGSHGSRTGHRPVLRSRGGRLRLGGPLLRGVRVDGPGRGQRLHVLVRDARRARRLDHRLGPDPRVRDRQHRRRHLVVGYFEHAPRGVSASTSRGLADHRLPHGAPAGARRGCSRRRPHFLGIPIVFNCRACSSSPLLTVVLVWGVKESARVQRGHGRRSSSSCSPSSCSSASVREAGELAPVRAERLRGDRSGAAIIFFAYIGFDAVSTCAEECRRTRSATCPSASSARSSSARSSTS